MSTQVYTYSEFLRYVGVVNRLNTLRQILQKPACRRIGKGALGRVYDCEGKIIKQTDLCGFGPETFHCQLASEKELIYLESQDGIVFIFVPDFIMEMLMAQVIKKLGHHLVGVPNFYDMGYEFSSESPSILLEMDKYAPLKFDQKIDEVDLSFVIFQCMISIYLLQHFLRFTHYDLHWGNIMLAPPAEKKIGLSEDVSFFFPEMEWPVIVDFGTSIFSLGSEDPGIARTQYINFTNNMEQPGSWHEFNIFFDGLTMLKSLQLQGIDIFGGGFKRLVGCFFKEGVDPLSFYVGNGRQLYRPDIKKIERGKKGLFAPWKVLKNLVSTFGGYELFNRVDYDFKGRVDFGLISQLPNISRAPWSPFLKMGEIPPPPISQEKIYFLSSHLPPLQIKTIMPGSSTHIFSFSLFVGQKYFIAAYKYMCDPNYELTIGIGKNGDDAFYRHYLGNQIDEFIYLLTNSGVRIDSPGYGVDQWADFGILNLVDEYAMNLPMFVFSHGIMIPWTKDETGILLDRNDISERCARGEDPKSIFKTYGWGTVGDFIKSQVIKHLNPEERGRLSIYQYSLPESMVEEVVVHGDIKYKNGSGFIGSLARFLPLQDPMFYTILFRDAHSTMPNRNFLYDRGWYNTWIGQTDYRLWTYHGAFYNPLHGEGLKITFAATWGARKKRPSSGSIFSVEEYEEIFGFSSIKSDHFFGAITYGIDERLMYRLTQKGVFKDDNYLVGVTHFLYLITGQTNPRNYKIFRDFKTGTVFSPSDLEDANAPDLINFDNKPYICREFDFIMPDTSFYTDMRCIFLASMNQAAAYFGTEPEYLSGEDYFDWLDKQLVKQNKNSCDTLWQMLPPRWNIWQYLFDNEYLDDVSLESYFIKTVGSKINLSTICKINRYLWIGDKFNYDEYFKGNKRNLPDVIPLPDNYPKPYDIMEL